MEAGKIPTHATPFIGRQSELIELVQLLTNRDCRLLTLAGLGGIGKTYLAIALAQQVQGRFADGAYFVPLQPLQSHEQIIPTIITTLGLKANQKPLKQLTGWLAGKQLLLVLDNYEHLLDGVDFLTEILDTAPQVTLLITSRIALRLRREWLRKLHGLDFLQKESQQVDKTLSAMQLFTERAQHQRGDLDIEAQYDNIIRICQLVEGMPLALELAASWVKSLSCGEIVTELERSLGLLKARTQDMPSRHSSMETVFNYSWHLLSEEEQAVLQSFSVFRGGFSRDAAKKVSGASLSILTTLVENSLVRHDPHTGRFDLHELLRQYASEKLDQTPNMRIDILDRHCTYYTDFLHQQEKTIHLNKQDEILIELDNFRMAWKYAVAKKNGSAIQRAAPSLHWLYHFQGWHDEGFKMFVIAEEAMNKFPETDDLRFLVGMIRLYRCFYTPEQLPQIPDKQGDIESALTLWDGLEDRAEMGLPLTRALIGLLSSKSEPDLIRSIANKSLVLSRRYDDQSDVAISLVVLAIMSYLADGDFTEAQQLLKEALEIDKQINFDLNARWAEGNLGEIMYLQGEYVKTKAHIEASIAHHYAAGMGKSTYDVLIGLGATILELNDDIVAVSCFEEGIALASNRQQHKSVARGQVGLAIISAFQGNTQTAMKSYEDIHSYLQTLDINTIWHPIETLDLGFLALLLGHYDYALKHYEAFLLRYKQNNYRVPIMCCNSRIGHALIGLGDEARATLHLFDALHEANSMGALQILLEALLGITTLSAVPPLTKVELLILINNHPASNRYSHNQVQQELSTLETTMPSNEFTNAQQRGHALTLEAAIMLVESFNPNRDNPPHRSITPLSQREHEVLSYIAEGFTNQEIADHLYIDISTVKKHINHIYSKLDVKHRTHAVVRARKLKLLD